LIPSFNTRELKRALKRMGVDVEEIENAERVEIVFSDKKVVIEKPQVLAIKMRDQVIYQVIGGTAREEAVEIPVSEEDVDFVVSQTGVSRERAREALIKTRGNIVEAILLIKEGRV